MNPDVENYTITFDRTELIPGGKGAYLAFSSSDFPGKQFLIIPKTIHPPANE